MVTQLEGCSNSRGELPWIPRRGVSSPSAWGIQDYRGWWVAEAPGPSHGGYIRNLKPHEPCVLWPAGLQVLTAKGLRVWGPLQGPALGIKAALFEQNSVNEAFEMDFYPSWEAWLLCFWRQQ